MESIQNKLSKDHPLNNPRSIEILRGVILACEYGNINRIEAFRNYQEFNSLNPARRLYQRYLNGDTWYRVGRHLSDDQHTKIMLAVIELAKQMIDSKVNYFDTKHSIIINICKRFKLSFEELSDAWNDLAINIEAEVDRYISLQSDL